MQVRKPYKKFASNFFSPQEIKKTDNTNSLNENQYIRKPNADWRIDYAYSDKSPISYDIIFKEIPGFNFSLQVFHFVKSTCQYAIDNGQTLLYFCKISNKEREVLQQALAGFDKDKYCIKTNIVTIKHLDKNLDILAHLAKNGFFTHAIYEDIQSSLSTLPGLSNQNRYVFSG